jgi:7-cyano-7-deazaguanine synthase
MDTNQSALVLHSGGQDSTTCLFWAIKNFKEVRTLCITYGQRHAYEVEVAQSIAKKAGVPFQVLDAGIISLLSENSLTNHEMIMDQEKPDDSYPNTFVPGRNLFFLTFAAVIARSHGIRNLVTGVSQADYSGYPDCRDTFIRSANATLNLAMDEQFIIHTPLMWLSKAETWALADELGVFEIVKNDTLTCYNGIIAEGCGHCPACKLRNDGLKAYLGEGYKVKGTGYRVQGTGCTVDEPHAAFHPSPCTLHPSPCTPLKSLGNKTEYKQDYSPEVLETFINKHTENDYWVRFNCPEFTSLCPITGQPDFATILIDYIPDIRMVESKSLKLYLFSYRNHGAFHEDCVNIIMKDLIRLMEPKYIEVTGVFTPRGGISIHPYSNYGRPRTQYETLAKERLSSRNQ